MQLLSPLPTPPVTPASLLTPASKDKESKADEKTSNGICHKLKVTFKKQFGSVTFHEFAASEKLKEGAVLVGINAVFLSVFIVSFCSFRWNPGSNIDQRADRRLHL